MGNGKAWELGMFASPRKAYVGEGGSWIWTIWEQYFKPFGFVAILDFIHGLTYVYAAAMAGRTTRASRTSRFGNVLKSQPGGVVMCIGRDTE